MIVVIIFALCDFGVFKLKFSPPVSFWRVGNRTSLRWKGPHENAPNEFEPRRVKTNEKCIFSSGSFRRYFFVSDRTLYPRHDVLTAAPPLLIKQSHEPWALWHLELKCLRARVCTSSGHLWKHYATTCNHHHAKSLIMALRFDSILLNILSVAHVKDTLRAR